jgi:shikimate kinase
MALKAANALLNEIILIGPMGSGKSTQGELLAAALGLPRCSMDDLRWDYYKEIGFSEETQRQIGKNEGFAGIYRYWKPFEAHAVERLVSEHRGCVIDFGGGHSVFEDDALFARIRKALAPYRNVVLLLPSPNLDESISLLRARNGEPPPGDFDLNAHFVTHHSSHDLATIVVYTKDRTPEQTRDDILAAVQSRQRTGVS